MKQYELTRIAQKIYYVLIDLLCLVSALCGHALEAGTQVGGVLGGHRRTRLLVVGPHAPALPVLVTVRRLVKGTLVYMRHSSRYAAPNLSSSLGQVR